MFMTNLQHFFGSILAKDREKSFIPWHNSLVPAADRARFLSCQGALSGAWLFNVPKDKHNTMPPESFRTAFLLRLGIPLNLSLNFCSCNSRTDPHGVHLLSCPKFIQLRTLKHDRVIQEFRFLATSGGNRSETHNLDLFRELDPGNGLKPDILLYGVGTNGCNVLMDATFGDPRGQTNVDKAWNTRGYVINMLNGMKFAKYGHLCDAIGIEFHPAAF